MKVRLTKDRIIGEKQYGKDSVVDLFQPEVEAIIAAGEGVAVPDGTMARKRAYGVPGCMPPAGFESNLQSVFAGLAVDIAQNEPTNDGTLPSANQSDSMVSFFVGAAIQDAKTDHGAKQKTNTLKK